MNAIPGADAAHEFPTNSYGDHSRFLADLDNVAVRISYLEQVNATANL